MHRHRGLAGAGGDRHAVAEHVVEGLVGLVKLHALHPSLALQDGDGAGDDLGRVAAGEEPGAEQLLFDIGVAHALLPIAQVAPAEAGGAVGQKGDDPVLGLAFRFADHAHAPCPLPEVYA